MVPSKGRKSSKIMTMKKKMNDSDKPSTSRWEGDEDELVSDEEIYEKKTTDRYVDSNIEALKKEFELEKLKTNLGKNNWKRQQEMDLHHLIRDYNGNADTFEGWKRDTQVILHRSKLNESEKLDCVTL